MIPERNVIRDVAWLLGGLFLGTSLATWSGCCEDVETEPAFSYRLLEPEPWEDNARVQVDGLVLTVYYESQGGAKYEVEYIQVDAP